MSLRDDMLKDLARSGITESQAKKLKLKPLDSERTMELGHLNAPSYRIPYFELTGKVNGYYRVRYLKAPVGKFGEVMTKVPRYSGPADTPPHAYFAPNVKWLDVARDTEQLILLTEGEKKGYAGCLAGGNVIALGGVAMYQSRNAGFDFLPELEKFKWEGRSVIICFDSDKHNNPNIIREQNTLAMRLLERDAHVYIADLPELPSSDKTGLDDYLAHYPVKQRKVVMADIIEQALDNEYAASAELWALQDELAYIERHGSYYHFKQEALIKNVTFLENGAFANRFYDEPAPTEREPDKTIAVNAFKAWRQWPNRRAHEDIAYLPGEPEVVNGVLNVWPDWGVEPVKGSIAPFTKLVDFLFQYEPTLKPWFWQWLAYPIQYPGTKLYSAMVLHGPMQGTGKTFLGEIIGDVYGENYSLLSQDDLEDKFNDAFARKQFALADEVVATGKDARKHADKLKGFITRQTIPINKKWEAKYTLRDTVNYLFTSNHFDAIYIEQHDRRYAVVKVPDKALGDDFYRTLRAWRADGGPAKLMHHLLHNIDVSDFDPLSKPPLTEAHAEMVVQSRTDIEQWCVDLFEIPDSVLAIGNTVMQKTFFQPAELRAIYDGSRASQVSQKAFANAMIKAGFPKTRRACAIPNSSRRVNLYCVREIAKWERKTNGEWGIQYAKEDQKLQIKDKVRP